MPGLAPIPAFLDGKRVSSVPLRRLCMKQPETTVGDISFCLISPAGRDTNPNGSPVTLFRPPSKDGSVVLVSYAIPLHC